jgi:spore coat polysaccharide biosynthesis protein SpsF
MAYITEQEEFWAGEFGDNYVDRNADRQSLISKTVMFSKIISNTHGVKNILELGSNIGLNLKALKYLIPDAHMTAVEINQKAAAECAKIQDVTVHQQSIYEYNVEEGAFDLAFTAGVLIHIPPEKLSEVYDILYRSSKKYILVSEYYNPTPVEVAYRGNAKRLFKRDFAGELMDKYSSLQLVDYGFMYHRDNNFPADDDTWFLLEKR